MAGGTNLLPTTSDAAPFLKGMNLYTVLAHDVIETPQKSVQHAVIQVQPADERMVRVLQGERGELGQDAARLCEPAPAVRRPEKHGKLCPLAGLFRSTYGLESVSLLSPVSKRCARS